MKLLEKINVKKIISYIAIFIIGMFLGYLSAPTCSDSSHKEIEQTLEERNKEIDTLNEKIESAKPWFEMKKIEQKKLKEELAEKKAKEEAKKKAEEEKARKEQEEKEKEEARKREEEEKKGYDTGVTYKDLARNPEEYIGEKVKFEGEVIQIMEGDGEVQMRLAVGGDYDNVIYCTYDSSIVSSRVLENDYITVMGISSDLVTYTSTMGGEITIPSMLVERIDM